MEKLPKGRRGSVEKRGMLLAWVFCSSWGAANVPAFKDMIKNAGRNVGIWYAL